MVVFEQAKQTCLSAFSHQKRLHGDDYDGMRRYCVVFLRGLSENNEGWELPQLLIVDGGTGQLNIALEVSDDLDVSGVDVIGVVKPRTHRKRGDMDMPDRIVSPDLIEPVRQVKRRPSALVPAENSR